MCSDGNGNGKDVMRYSCPNASPEWKMFYWTDMWNYQNSHYKYRYTQFVSYSQNFVELMTKFITTKNVKNSFWKASTSTIHNGSDHMIRYNLSPYNLPHSGLKIHFPLIDKVMVQQNSNFLLKIYSNNNEDQAVLLALILHVIRGDFFRIRWERRKENPAHKPFWMKTHHTILNSPLLLPGTDM